MPVHLRTLVPKRNYCVVNHLLFGLGMRNQGRLNLADESLSLRRCFSTAELLEQILYFPMLLLQGVENVGRLNTLIL